MSYSAGPVERHPSDAGADSAKASRFMRKSVFAGSVGTGTLMALQAALGMAVAALLARLMGPENFGIYSFGLAVATLLSIPTKSGVSRLIVREVARAQEAENWPRLRAVLRWALFVTLLYCLIVAGSVAAASVLFAANSPIAQAVAIAMLLVLFWSLLGNWAGGVRGLGYPVSAMLPDSILRPTMFIALIGCLVWVVGDQLTPDGAMYLHIAATAMAALWIMVVFRGRLPARARSVRTFEYAATEWSRAALPFAVLGGLQIATRQADLIILGLLTDEKQVGLYRVAIQGSMLITFGSQAIGVVVAPYFARHKEGGSRETLWTLMRMSVFFSLAVAIPGVLAFAVLGREVITLVFGVEFAAAHLPLTILAAANALAMLNGAVVPLLNMTGNERDTLKVFAWAVVVNLALNFTLIPAFGTTGAAVAALLSTLCWSHLLRRAASRQLSVDPLATLIHRRPRG